MSKLEILNTTLPTVAIVGRPNVGKSTLFNRLVGRRKATVLDTPGVTRDRNFETAEWNDRPFTLVDTGGYETEPRDATFGQMCEQSLLAMREADVVIFLTDVRDSDNPVDQDVAILLRRSGKPIFLAVNKCDNPRSIQESLSFHAFGFQHLFSISALSGSGVGDMLDAVIEALPPAGDEKQIRAASGIRIAVIGRPNVGKSSLVNAILGHERVIVNPMPGTTRDTIDTTFRLPSPSPTENEEFEDDEENAETNDRVYTLIDTAGLRRRGKIVRGVEKLCAMSAEASLNRCDVALVLIDAEEGLTEQDQNIAGMAHNAHRPVMLIVNKWDLVEKDTDTAGAFVKMLRHEMGFLNYAPILMISAKTGQRVHRILAMVDQLNAESHKEISTPDLNEWLKDATRRLSPPWHKGKQLRIKYVTQIGKHPPTFALFVNNPKLIHFSYERYLVNRLRETFGFEGVPIRLKLRRKSKERGED